MIDSQALITVMNLWYLTLGLGAIAVAGYIVLSRKAAKAKQK